MRRPCGRCGSRWSARRRRGRAGRPPPNAIVACRTARASLAGDTSNETGCPAAGRAGVAVMEMAVAGSRTTEVVARVSTDAITSAAAVVSSAVRGSPDVSVVTTRSRRVPAVAAKATRTLGSGLCRAPRRRAAPCRHRARGWRAPRSGGGRPRRRRGLDLLAQGIAGVGPQARRAGLGAGREGALARPRAVGASAGWTVPSVAVKVTTVPLCTGAPAASVTAAVTEAPFGSDASATTSRTDDRVGATSGTESHDAPSARGASRTAGRTGATAPSARRRAST